MSDTGLSANDIAQIISLRKCTSTVIGWGASISNGYFSEGRTLLEDSDGITLPGLLFEVQFRQGAVVERCKYSFSLWQLRSGVRHLVMRLDVGPWDKKTHNAVVPLYGSHLHIGQAVLPIAPNGLNCKDYADWCDAFCRLAGIRLQHPYQSPYEFSLEMRP